MDELRKVDVKNSDILSDKHLFILEDSIFETMSKRAWTDVLLQIYKVNCRYICYLNSEELILISTNEPFVIFLSCCSVEEGE